MKDSNLTNRYHRLVLLPLIFCLLGTTGMGALPAKDAVVVTSNKIAEIDKAAGTVILQDTVRAVRESTGSSLATQYLLIVRDTTTDVLLEALAEGEVEMVHRERPTVKTSEAEPPLSENPIFVWCDRAFFDRKAALGELKGSVRVESEDFKLEADIVRYHYDSGLGNVNPAPGKQVHLVVRKVAAGDAPAKTERTEIIGLANEIRINRPARKITLQCNVFIVDVAEDSELKARRADVFFTADEQVERIIATENFSMKQPGRISSADQAVFEYDKEEVTLIGNAYVKEEEQVKITSSRIQMHMKAGKGVIRGTGDVPVRMEIPLYE
jgi:lipopolysaccharide export system protein LptA